MRGDNERILKDTEESLVREIVTPMSPNLMKTLICKVTF
jgi:hypothetical protein